MKIPVLVYGSSVCLMVIMAALRIDSVSRRSFWWVTIGAILFMLSDSIIAINKFLYEGNLPLASFFIMLTYIIAQFFIVHGFLLSYKSTFRTIEQSHS